MRARRLLPAAVLVALLATAAPSPALAGGIGFFNGTGFHFGESLTTAGGTGSWLNEGGGVEILLGSRGGRVHGRLRFAYNAIIDLNSESELPVQHAGILGLGFKIELLDDVDQPFGLYLAADVGVAPLVTNLRSFFFFDVGPGIRIRPVERFSLFVEATFLLRYAKVFTAGPMFFLGARVDFD